ncbi:MAG: response regulator [Rubrivivax sp.]|jgi:DNA-binding response OmpR family regulator|nr:response regulator [Rubrivivax sp.]
MTPPPKTLLLVEDDAAVRQFVAMALEDEPMRLQACASLASARAWIEAAAHAPDAVLLDLMLPDGSGVQLLDDAALRARWPATAWVLFSAGRAAEWLNDAAAMRRRGVVAVLEKPVSLSRLLQVVRAACASAAPAVAGLPVKASGGVVVNAPPDAGIPDSVDDLDGSDAAAADAVARYFEGQAPLFEQMRAFSGPLMRRELAELSALAMALSGSPLAKADDWAEARRLAHSMKTVLAMMGFPTASQEARQAELCAELQRAAGLVDACSALTKAAGRWPPAA